MSCSRHLNNIPRRDFIGGFLTVKQERQACNFSAAHHWENNAKRDLWTCEPQVLTCKHRKRYHFALHIFVHKAHRMGLNRCQTMSWCVACFGDVAVECLQTGIALDDTILYERPSTKTHSRSTTPDNVNTRPQQSFVDDRTARGDPSIAASFDAAEAKIK